MAKAPMHIVILVVLITSLIAPSLLADFDTGLLCELDEDCEFDFGSGAYCSPLTATCFQPEAEEPFDGTGFAPPSDVSLAPAPISSVEDALATIQADLVGISSVVTMMTTTLNNVQNRLNQLSEDINAIKSESQQVTRETSGLSTGLAGLQRGLNETQENVSALNQVVAEEQNFTNLITYTFFALLIVAIALGIIYYINRGKQMQSIASPQVVGYITKHIKQGKKFPFIKENLRKAGWSEEDILLAYKETMRQNYQQYLQKKAGSPVSGPSLSDTTHTQTQTSRASSSSKALADRSKIIGITIVSILLILGIFFLLRGTVGKAVFFDQSVESETKEIIYSVSCTPPQILTPEEDACCDDLNNNLLCDNNEREVALPATAGCTDNLQCSSDQYCLNAECASLATIYKGSPLCDKRCNYYSVKVSTSDDETYTVRPKRGSYTCVGALEWKIMPAPDHCNGERAIVPVKIIMKEPGKILSEYFITIKARESKTITHPNLPGCSVSLTVDEVFELCE